MSFNCFLISSIFHGVPYYKWATTTTLASTYNPNAFYSKEWHVDPEILNSEDGLYLNIWTGAKSSDEKLPVLVWYLVFCYAPMGGLVLAFKKYSVKLGIWGSKWVGLEHFERFFNSFYFIFVQLSFVI